MNRYSLSLRPTATFGVMPAGLTREAIAQSLAGVVVRELSGSPAGGYQLEVQLQRSTHSDALDEIANGVANFGLDVAQAYITEIATDTLAGVILGGAGGAVGGGATQNPGAAFLTSLLGMVVGGIVGSARERVVAEFLAYRPHPFAPWSIQPISRSQEGWAPA